jgi:hypothetical protein
MHHIVNIKYGKKSRLSTGEQSKAKKDDHAHAIALHSFSMLQALATRRARIDVHK